MSKLSPPIGEHEIANVLFEEGRYEEALQKYRPLAEGGCTSIQLRIGWMYHKGQGVNQDLEEAYRWYKKAADANVAEGQFYLGTLYRTKKQYDQAREWFERSAAQDYSPALYRLGRMYEVGEGVEADRRMSEQYYHHAAQAGHVRAQKQLAVQMLRGQKGLLRIPQGFCTLARVVVTTAIVAWKDPYSERIRW